MADRAREFARLKRALYRRLDAGPREVTVVYAQGKTGTSSIAKGLKRAGFDPVFQIHTLNPRTLENVEAQYIERRSDNHPRHVWEAQWLNAHRPSVERPWTLVTSVRDPIARIVSRYFQQESRFGGLRQGRSADELASELHDQFLAQNNRLGGIGWDWFEAELAPVLGQSVYDTPFDPAVGHATIETPHVRALIVRNESLDRAPDALRTHFGRPVEISSENVGTDKDYGTLYRDVLARFRPPAGYVDRVYRTRQATHFYAPEELERFRARWTRPL